MKIHTFRGPGRIFGFTPDKDGTNLPTQYGPWSAFKSLEMIEDRPQQGVDVNECLEDIRKHGFHLTDAHVRITERALTHARRPQG